MLSYLDNFLFNSWSNYNYSILLFNIFAYVFLLFNIFSILFLFDLKYVKTLGDFKFIGSLKSLSIYVVIILMSFSGIPPLLGFASKFLIFLNFFSKSFWILIIFFSFLNFFVIYFYLQNFRFLVSKVDYNSAIISLTFVSSYDLIVVLNFLNLINLFSIAYTDDILLYFNFLTKNFFF